MADKNGFVKNGVEFRLGNEDLYYYEAFRYGNVGREELRSEYTRLRQTANKRLERMKGTKYENSQTYIRNAGKYTTIAQIEKEALLKAPKNLSKEARQKYVDAHIAKKMADLYRFLTAKSGSIRGMQRMENNLIKSMHDKGMTFINKDNIQQFAEYMEYLRVLYTGKQYSSERSKNLFAVAIKKGIDPMEVAKDYEYWKNHVDELSKMPKISNENKRTAEEYKKRLNIDK